MIKMPFAGYKDFNACVIANQDKDDPEAYCGAIKHKVEEKVNKQVIWISAIGQTIFRIEKEK